MELSAKLAFAGSTMPQTWQWREDSQPEKHSKVKNYIDLAHKMSRPALEWAVQILKASGYITEDKHDEVLEKLAKLQSGKYLKLNGVAVAFRVKSEKSSHAKILMDSITNKPKLPDDIGDYLGIEFVGESVADDINLVNAIVSSGNMSSRKDEFSKPSDDGHRSHKSHHTISHEGRRLSIEVKVSDAAMVEKADKLTHKLMRLERAYFDFQSDLKKAFGCSHGRINRMAAEADIFHSLRVAINSSVARQAGLDILVKDGEIIGERQVPLPALSRKLQKRVIAILGPETVAEIKNVLAANNNDDFLYTRSFKVA